MIVKIDFDSCIINKISCYNDNYYQLPFQVNGCNVIHEKYDGGDNFYGFKLGNIVDGVFIFKYYVNTFDLKMITIDSEKLSEDNDLT